MVEGEWIYNPHQIKEESFKFYKRKFQSFDSSFDENSNPGFVVLCQEDVIVLQQQSLLMKFVNSFGIVAVVNPQGQMDSHSYFLKRLHLTLEADMHSKCIKGVTAGNPSINLSHFFFADDVMIPPEWDTHDL
ncbi:hypothetical protein Tco_0110387 [Tanacetum coccineum]